MKKLSLKKETIAPLDSSQFNQVVGGVNTDSLHCGSNLPTVCICQPNTDICATFDWECENPTLNIGCVGSTQACGPNSDIWGMCTEQPTNQQGCW